MIRRRLFLVGVALFLGFGAVLFRAFQLQVLPSAQVEKLAHRQLSRRIEIAGRRGSITDRNGRELAVSVNSLSVFANPSLVLQPERAAKALAPVLGISEEAVLGKIRGPGGRKFVWVARQLDRTQLERLEALDLHTLPGIGVLPEFRREYPLGRLASHVLGFSGIDGQGIEGSEKAFDSWLAGEKNSVSLNRDALGRPLFSQADQIRLELNHGEAVELTIDTNLQYTAEQALHEAVEVHKAEGGTAIVMDPSSGEILALANDPAFDPNAPTLSPSDQRRNRALSDPIEPGSVMKPFVVARALEDGIVTPQTMLSGGKGFIKVGRKIIGEAEAKHRFEKISVEDLIRVSSNVATVVLQQKMGFPRIEDAYRKLGFGSLTGIELGGESRGIFRTPTKSQVLEQATMSFGQGISVTPLQIAAAYSALANDGLAVPPTILRRIGAEERKDTPPASRRVFSKKVADRMHRILERVVDHEGTGQLARLENFGVAGKTGTAQKVDYRNGGYESGAYWSSFVGYTPVQHARFVIYVMIDHPTEGGYYGSSVAAPVFAKIARAALQLAPREAPPVVPVAAKGAKPAAPMRTPLPVAKLPRRSVVARTGAVPDLVGLPVAQALRSLRGTEVEVDVKGEGNFVWDQFPPAGEPLGAEARVSLRLR
jgi:cell division protein FtsI (penicillin-binding protein 3)